MITAIYIGTDRLDLYKDENIAIKSTVSKISDITKIFTDTTQSFAVPANETNNKIFKYWFNADVYDGFDARKKVDAVIEIGGVNFKVGKIKLNKVNLKSNQPYTYSIQYFGNLVSLKDKVQDDKLTSLDLSSLDFVFNSDNVKNKLQNVSDVCFSLLSKRRLLYDSVNTITVDDKQTNIYYNNNDVNSGLQAGDLKASIKQLKIIEAIEDKYNLEFSRDFLGIYDFSSQYMALTGTGDKTVVQLPLTNADEGIDPTVNGNVMMAEGYGTDADRLTMGIQLGISVDSQYENAEYSFYIKNGDEIVGKRENVTGSFLTSNVLNVQASSVNGGFNNVTFWLESAETIVFQAEMYRNRPSVTNYRYKYNSGELTPEISFNVSNRLPDITVLKYLQGIFKMSKLVAIPQKNGTIYVDSLVNYYRKGKVVDLTKYVDYKSQTISAGKILNEIKYNFEEPKTILAKQFKNNNDVSYGDLELKIYDNNGVLIDGSKLEYKLPFENIVYEKIRDLSNDSFNTNIQYGLLQDENLDFVNIKPHIHYIQRFNSNIKFIDDSGIASNLFFCNVPLHILDNSLQTFSTTFGSEFNEYNDEIINNTIYTNYHKNFIERIFSKNKREVSIKAKDIPLHIVLNLQLNDVIEIKDKFYRIDEFTTNTINNNIDFKLINDRYVDLTPLYPVSADSTVITADRTDITADSTSSKKIEPINIM